jgi:ATP-dependent DNA helicase RecG
LKKELGIHTFRQLLEHFPYRHLDKTKITLIKEITPETDYVQVAGKLMSLEIIGSNRGRRLIAELKDSSGTLELVWFQGISWIEKKLHVGESYVVFGKAGFFSELSPDNASRDRNCESGKAGRKKRS